MTTATTRPEVADVKIGQPDRLPIRQAQDHVWSVLINRKVNVRVTETISAVHQQRVSARCEVGNRVLAITGKENESISARSSDQEVIPPSTGQRVIPWPTIQCIIPNPTSQIVVSKIAKNVSHDNAPYFPDMHMHMRA
ncbi:hypothetical protein [Rhodovastum atsumiense]|uniref:hypothetical protein n=1 Tax=Rhodovastum atsumiense TaxID=504468 RepID=UPI0020240729|nr:hypothetical protein [Rhodovastum atsumiense]